MTKIVSVQLKEVYCETVGSNLGAELEIFGSLGVKLYSSIGGDIFSKTLFFAEDLPLAIQVGHRKELGGS
ncbi:hypothetical protein [Bacillus sp. TE8-1]|uniref:hypothetical protein n=1 Tax=Bacillus sp. TE8-1 TaxID=2217829 RepID=UPI0011ECC686|nr:hypothetical protein [Bacillus sp. TE8-1]KAA0780929.1 hypothetical protein DN404_00395 [Bacillus sp. TE8-1]